MTLSPALRKLALTVHLTSSVGWIGAVVAYLALGVAAVTSAEVQTIRAAWTAMDLTGWWVIVPLAIAALLTGLVMSLATRWGLFRHYWVLISLILTLLCTVVLVLHMPTVSRMATFAQTADIADLRALGGDLFHPGVGLGLLILITGLNVFKPAGLTPYGWRKQREERAALKTTARRVRSERGAARPPASRSPSVFRAIATQAGYFTLHFTEMWFAMFLGMALFMVVTIALSAQGVVTNFQPSSVTFDVWMSLFMVIPMAAWMRIRGCDWRDCAGMSTAMLLPTAAILVLWSFEGRDAQLWVTSNLHLLMLVGMLAFMLYRREHYARGYSLFPRASRSARADRRPSATPVGPPTARLEAP